MEGAKKKTARQLAAEAAAVDTYKPEPVRTSYVPGVITNSPGRPGTGAQLYSPTWMGSKGEDYQMGSVRGADGVDRTPTYVDGATGEIKSRGFTDTQEVKDFDRAYKNEAQLPSVPAIQDSGGGGGRGYNPVTAQMLGLISQARNQGAYQYQDLAVPDYVGPQFREYDGSMYDTARSGITRGLASDAASGATAYGDARTELSQYQDPFTGRSYATNQGIPEAMQRMMRANNVGMEQTEIDRGIQADAAFGNVLALLGGSSQQAQDSNMRALAGDERRFNESLASQGRTMSLGVDMTEAKARQQYSQDAFDYGEGIARQNYDKNMQVASANNAGRNQAMQVNSTRANDANNTLINLLASGQGIDPAALAAYMGG